MNDIANLRKSYERAELNETASHADPMQQFDQWLKEAIQSEVPEPNAMTLATVGAERITVYAKPRVAILPTGDEIVDVGTTPQSFQIRNSNAYSLAAQIASIGVPYAYLGIVPDLREALSERLDQAMKAADVIILTGGVSAGGARYGSTTAVELAAQRAADKRVL